MTTVAREQPDLGSWPHTRHSRMVLRGGIRWHVQVTGTGPVMLMLHGTGASSHSFRDLMPILSRRFTVVAPDLPGHAFSEPPPSFEPTLPGTAAALAELLDALGLAPDVVVGHSAGAAIAIQMVLDRTVEPRLVVGIAAALVPLRGAARAILPRAARALAIASRVFTLRVKAPNAVERLVESTGSRLDRPGLDHYRRLSERPAHVAGVLSMMSQWDLDTLFAQLPELNCRLLLVAGESDRAVPASQQRVVAARAPRGRVVVVPGTGHLVHEEKPEAVARLVLAELEGLAGAPHGPGRDGAR